MKREVLERPFDANLIKTRRGHSGKVLSYVEGAEYIRRLNEAFNAEWSFEILTHEIHGRDIVVVGQLRAGGVTKVAFGGSKVTMSSESNEPLNLADDLKAAATDALKKASSLLGLGLHLYFSEMTEQSADGNRSNVSTLQPRPISERQLNAIMAIARKLGWSSDVLRQHSIDAFGVAPNELTRSDASVFIGELQQLNLKNAA